MFYCLDNFVQSDREQGEGNRKYVGITNGETLRDGKTFDSQGTVVGQGQRSKNIY